MKKMNVKPLIISALTAVAFGAVGVGTTFALFTDKAETSISVQAGKVEIEDSIVIKSVESLNTTDTDTKIIPDKDNKQASFQNGGSVAITTTGGVKSVDIQKMTPGDKVVLEINEINKSNVKIKTRFKATHTSTTPDNDLFDALTITYTALDKNNNDISYKFMDWNLLDIPATEQELIAKITVTIEFKDHDNGQILFGNDNNDNDYQNSNCSIVFVQEAVQGNAAVLSLIDEMNNKLASQPVKNNTLTDALADVSTLANVDVVQAMDYVWNSETDRFEYAAEVTSGTKSKYFKVYSSMPSTQTYSIYAYGWTTQATVNLNGVGFDAGNSTGISAINYENTTSTAKTSIINSNSYLTTLTINAENDIVHHYGSLGYLNIIAVAGESYHENGKVAYTEISKGRIVLEKGSDVEEIHVNKKTDSSFDTVIIANNGGTEELPERITRDAVTVSSETLVVKVESNNSSESVYVYASGALGTTEKTSTQNTTVESPLGQLVLDNGSAGEKAQTAEQKEETKGEVVDKAIGEEVTEDLIEANYKARIGKNGYESFAAALESVQNGQTIVLLDNAEFGSQITISNNIGIDLFGHTLSFLPLGNNSYFGPTVTAFRIQEGGTLKLKDSASTKGQFVINAPYTCNLTFAYNYGTLNIDGLTVLLDVENYYQSVDTTKWNTTCPTNRGSVNGINNYGTLNINNSTINNASKGGTTSIMNYGTLSMQRSILNLTGNSSNSYGISANASNNNVASINNISNSTINILEQGQGLTFTKAIATVSNCTINMSGTQSMSGSNACGIYVGQSAIAVGEPEVLITGNTKVTANYSSYGATCINVNAGHVVIDEGVVVDGGSNGYALRFGASALSGFENAAQLEVKGGTYSGEVNSISKTGTMVISGGTFNGDICLSNGSSTQSTVVISGGTFNGDIKATGDYLYTIEDNENVHFNWGAQIGDVKYTTLNAAINAANDNDKIVVLKDSNTPVFASNGKTFTVDLNGHTISINNNDTFNVYNNTNVTLIDTNEGEKGSIVTTCDGCSAIWIGSGSTDNSSLIINDGITLTGTAHAICLNAGTVTVTINSATLNGDISKAEGTTLIDNRQ